jgi:hypothetical protein
VFRVWGKAAASPCVQYCNVPHSSASTYSNIELSTTTAIVGSLEKTFLGFGCQYLQLLVFFLRPYRASLQPSTTTLVQFTRPSIIQLCPPVLRANRLQDGKDGWRGEKDSSR